MIKRTIEISQEAVHLSTKHDQLQLVRHNFDEQPLASIPCEDIGVVVVDQNATTYSHAALTKLMDNGAAVVLCGRNHLPCGLLLPLSNHTEVVWRIREQIAIAKPLRKQLWKQIVVAKVHGQALNLEPDSLARRKLLNLARSVKSGDPTNIEAQAAKIYWSVWLGEKRPFQRDPAGHDPLNVMLNYGYAIVRAALGRALVSAGLHPALGLHHANRSNAFCLADDFLEVFRPLVDRAVRDLDREGFIALNPDVKKRLLGLLTATMTVGDQKGPLLVVLPRIVASLVRCLQGKRDKLLLPHPCLGQE